MNFIQGFGIANFRSFGNDLQYFGPLKKVNVIIGQNNSGKSNVLQFIHRFYEPIRGKSALPLTPSDRPKQLPDSELRFSFSTLPSFQLIEERIAPITKGLHRQESYWQILSRIFQSDYVKQSGGAIQFEYTAKAGERFEYSDRFINEMKDSLGFSEGQWVNLWQAVTGGSGANNLKNYIYSSLRPIDPTNFLEGTARLIPAIRKLGGDGDSSKDHSGVGLIHALAEIQHPDIERENDRKRFDAIENFVRDILENSTVSIEIPRNQKTIHVEIDGKKLPIEHLGTGIHEIIILAAKCTVFDNNIVCIEEPEIHVHPSLQRKLVHYLATHTNNQYLITTHSAHILDATDCAIFHVRLRDGFSAVEHVQTDLAKVGICSDLGYRASDIVQANSVVWVEGPSDRIYLNWWLKFLDDTLEEGIHFSIMFYGGNLHAHLSGSSEQLSDEVVDDLIEMRRLNQWSALVMDSDRQGKRERLKGHKKRLAEEFSKEPCITWFTKGREIENYIPTSQLEAAVKAVHKTAIRLAATDDYAKKYEFKQAGGKVIKNVNKVAVAREVVKHQPELNVLDLHEKLKELVRMIRKANGLD